MSDTFDRLQTILVEDHKAAPGALTTDSRLDALGTVELLWGIEEAFGVKLPPEPVALATVGDVVVYLDALRTARSEDVANAATTPPPDPVLQRMSS